MIRAVRGMSRIALARACGWSSEVVAKFEHGGEFPAESEVSLLASALRVAPSFFEGADIPMYGSGQASFRARSSLTKQTMETAQAMMSVSHVVSEWFDSRVLNVSVDVPDLSGESPEAAADILRAHWGLGHKGISNVIHIMETKGVRVFAVDQLASNMDAFCGWLGERPAVFLRRGTTGARCRFDACHELGHLVLHKGRDWSKDDVIMEREADQFASAFLMPRPAVVALIKPHVPFLDLVKLKAHWKVSVMALNRRLRDLGVFSDQRYLENVKEISRRGWRSAEPEDAPFEGSLVWNKAVDHVGRTGSSIDKVASEIGLEGCDVERMLTSFVTTRASTMSVPRVQSSNRGHLGWASQARLVTNPNRSSDSEQAGKNVK